MSTQRRIIQAQLCSVEWQIWGRGGGSKRGSFRAQGKRSQYTDRATGWTIRDSNSSMGKRSVSSQNVQTDSVAHPASHSMGTGSFSPGIKKPRHKADHSSPSYAEVKNEWSYTSTPTIRFHDVARDNFTFRVTWLISKCYTGGLLTAMT